MVWDADYLEWLLPIASDCLFLFRSKPFTITRVSQRKVFRYDFDFIFLKFGQKRSFKILKNQTTSDREFNNRIIRVENLKRLSLNFFTRISFYSILNLILAKTWSNISLLSYDRPNREYLFNDWRNAAANTSKFM